MASIRKRLSQLWRRNGEKDTPKGDEQSSAAHRDSISSLDSGYSSITSPSAIDSAQQATPRNLHKAASMTFQSFSDTIRSKTRVFYASPEKLDAQSWDCTEDTPKSHQPRSSIILSSVMSHDGHVNLDYRLESGRNSPTPMPRVAKFQWTTPTIDVKIPDSFLTDSEISEDSAYKSSTKMAHTAPTQAKLKPYGSWQLWPTPIDVALQQLSKVDLSTASVPRSPMIDDSNVNSSEDFMYDSAMFDPDSSRLPPSAPEDQTPKIEESSGNNSFHDKAVVTKLKSPDPGLGYSPGPLPSTDAAKKRRNPDNSCFSKGDGTSLQGTHVTWSLPDSFRKEVEDIGMVSEGFGSSLQPNHAEMPLPYFNTTQRPIFHRTISHKAGLRDLVAASNSFLNHEGQEHGTRQPSSSVYESDEEPEAPSAETPAMGSRREWDKVRADRYNRYSAIRFLDDDEITEEDSEFGLELEKSSARPLEDALRAITESDTNDIDQGVDLAFADDEVADLQEKSPEPNRLPKESRSDMAEGDLYQGFDAYEWSSTSEWPSPSGPLMTGHSVDAEAALRRLAERKPDWISESSYESEDELYIQYERPGDVTSFPALLAPFEDDQERKNAGSEELDPGSLLSAHQSEIQDDSYIENCEETDPYGYYSLGSGVVWSRLSKMDAPGSTKFLEGDALDEKDECTEGILSDNECSPLDESPVYLNPSPFPDLKKDSDDGNSPSSIITEHTFTDQTSQPTSLATEDVGSSPTSSSPSVIYYEGFWTNLELDLKDCSVQYQTAGENAQGQGENNTNEYWRYYDNPMKGPDEIEINHEFDNPDRAFNAARLPNFNQIPSPAPENLVGGEGKRYHNGDSPGRTMIKKENETNNPGASGHPRWSRKKRPVNMIGWSPSQPQDRGDQTSPGKKGVWWASDVEYIEQSSPTLSEESNESKRKANLSKLSLKIPKELAPKQLPERVRKWDDTEYCSNYVLEGQEW